MATHTATLQSYMDGNINRCYALVEVEVTSLPTGTDPLVIEISGELDTREISFNRSRAALLVGETFIDEPTAGIGLDTHRAITNLGVGTDPQYAGTMFWAAGSGISVGDTTQIAIYFASTSLSNVSITSPYASFSENPITLLPETGGSGKYAVVDMTVTSLPTDDSDIVATITAGSDTYEIPFNREVAPLFVDLDVTNGDILVSTGISRQGQQIISGSGGNLFYSYGDGIEVGDTTQLAIHFDDESFTEVTFTSDHASFADIAFTLPMSQPIPSESVNATLTIASDVISNTTFNGTITFASDVTEFDETDIALTAVDGNGVTGVTFTVSQQTASTYSINFTLPSDAEGAFTVEPVGTVIPDGETEAQAINANPSAPTVTYDTSVAVDATWGTPDYTVDDEDGQVAVPITFASGVIIEDVSIFQVSPVAPLVDDDLIGLELSLNKTSSTEYEVTLTLPLDLDGEVAINVTGEVYKISSMVKDSVTISALTLAVNTIIPQVVDSNLPTLIRGGMWDAKFGFNTPVEGIHSNNFQQVMRDNGSVNLGTANGYKWIGTGVPNLETSLLGTNPPPATDWAPLQTPPGGHAGPWYGEELQYLLMRFILIPQSAVASIFSFEGDNEDYDVRNKGY